ncbi:DUF4395 domain-containing protein [Sulfuriflexus mobilis]|uniref:DUF4395 domain-containing protein n=1 Tax=Sulfuriflexus mobilis TaxID=1811807 RepID=UPI000F81E231|nr:DUF4395 domain-containing protein [Sulfuriflexus mobilis]
MNKIIQFGEVVDGYDIPVLNEREIRAAAGLLFLMMFISVMSAALIANFVMLKFAVIIFLTDIIIRVFISPRYAPTLILGRLIVRNQNPEYVGAAQKKFAWYIGIVLGVLFFTFTVVMNSVSPISGIICFTCLIFLFFEAAFGICLGCLFYPMFFKDKVQYCPGEVCDVNDKQDIQKTSWSQILIMLGFIVFIIIIVNIFHESFSEIPYDLFGLDDTGVFREWK